MSQELNKVLDVLLKFTNKKSPGFNEVPPSYVIHLPEETFNVAANNLLSSSVLNSSQEKILKIILSINETLVRIDVDKKGDYDDKDKIEGKLIEYCREFVELDGSGDQLR